MKIAIFLLLLVSNIAFADDLCARIHVMQSWYLSTTALEETQYRRLYGKTPQEWFEHMATLDQVLNQKHPEYGDDDNFLNYSYIDEDKKEEISIQWADDAAKIASLGTSIGSEALPIEMKKLSTDVYSFEGSGKKFIARNIDAKSDIFAITQGRAAATASKVESHFGFDIYPDYKPQQINGKTYLVTEFSEGKTAGPRRGESAAKTYLRVLEDGSMKQESYWLAQGFSFLLGDKDSDATNTLRRPDGSVLLVDPGQALYFGADAAASDRSQNAFDYTPFGLVPPFKYSRKFIQKLEKMDHESWEDLLIDEALPEEIDLLMYRQRLMLLDIAARGEAAYFD